MDPAFDNPDIDNAPPADDATPPSDTPPSDPPADATPPADSTPPADDAPPADVQGLFASLPDSWRKDLVDKLELDGEDADKRMKMLDRIPDLQTLAKNYFEAQDKIRKGEMSTGLPDDPTEEQLAEYREAHGIPSTPEQYGEALAATDGLVLGEEDKAILDQVFPAALENNIPASAMNQMTQAFLAARDAEIEERKTQDGLDTQSAVKALKDVWGPDYNTNRNLVNNLVNTLPESVKEAFLGARLADGRAVFNSPEMGVFFADMARKLNPAATVVSANDANPIQTIDSEIAALEKKMEEGIADGSWHRDKASNQRLDQLYDAREKLQQSQ